MRKIIFLMHMSLDGYVAGPNGEMDWIVYNKDASADAYSLHKTTDTVIYGRVTYDMMKAYWQPALATMTDEDPDYPHTLWVNEAQKVVVSTTLEATDWKNTTIVKSDIEKTFNQMKQESGKDMWLLGSPTLTRTMMELNLIDEYRLNVSPVILGRGNKLFEETNMPINLKLIENKTFEGGVAALRYVPAES